MPSVDLSESEWGQVMNIISTAPWRDANPLLMKIGEQLRKRNDEFNPNATFKGQPVKEKRQ